MFHVLLSCKNKIITKIENWVITDIIIYKENLKTNPWTFFVVVIKVTDII